MILNKNLLYTISLFFLSCNDYCAKYQENQIIQMKIDSIVFAYDNFNIRKICYDCSPTVTLYFTYFNTDTSIQFIKLNVIDRYNDNICLFDSIFEIKDTFKLYKTEIDINENF